MPSLLPDVSALRMSVAARCREAGLRSLADRIEQCGGPAGRLRCQKCTWAHPIRGHCNLRWCPDCAWRLSARRCMYITAWSKLVKQPKHVILTSRNSEKCEPRRTAQAFTKLRRQKPFGWHDGCRTIETTNEGRGWHVHLHALVDVRWIDPGELAQRWGRLMGQDYAIVAVKDARLDDYLAEVCKYAVKPTQLATWTSADVGHFVRAHDRVRVFATFGSARGLKIPREPLVCDHCGEEGPWEYEPPTLGEKIDATADVWRLNDRSEAA